MLYPKQLNSLEELQSERAAIKKKARKMTAELEKTSASNKDLLQEGIGFLSGALSGNSAWAPLIEAFGTIALPALLKRGAQKGVRHMAGTLLREVGTGYLKWKALDIALRFAIKKMKEKRTKEA